MRAEDKAKELVEMYIVFEFHTDSMRDQREIAKQCALIAVDEIINVINLKTLKGVKHPISEYYQEVKTEIEKL